MEIQARMHIVVQFYNILSIPLQELLEAVNKEISTVSTTPRTALYLRQKPKSIAFYTPKIDVMQVKITEIVGYEQLGLACPVFSCSVWFHLAILENRVMSKYTCACTPCMLVLVVILLQHVNMPCQQNLCTLYFLCLSKMLLSVFRYDGHKRGGGGGAKSSRGRQKLKYKVKKEQKVSRRYPPPSCHAQQWLLLLLLGVLVQPSLVWLNTQSFWVVYA